MCYCQVFSTQLIRKFNVVVSKSGCINTHFHYFQYTGDSTELGIHITIRDTRIEWEDLS